ncbi:hypothetical protein CF319_g2928 [Tilletia indica]|nr:hypothetical protein CF319_g2928 [Tilletia indica]
MLLSNFATLILVAVSASLVEAGPSTSTSCYTVRISGTQTRTSSLGPQTIRPTITTWPVVKSTITVARPRTSTEVVATISTTRVTENVPAVTQTVTPTIFTVTVPVITEQAPAFTPTQTDFVIETVPGTFTTTSTTFTNPPGPTLPVALPRGVAGEEDGEEDDLQARDENDGVLDRRPGQKITPGNCERESQRLRGKRVYCRRVVRFAPITVAGTRTRTVTTAAATTSTIVASPITTTSTSTAATVTIQSTLLVPQPTEVVSRTRNVFCGPRARFYRSNEIGIVDMALQQLNFISPSGQDCCDAAADLPGAVGFADFDGLCIVVQIKATPLENFCVAGNPATGLTEDSDICNETCFLGGRLQCGA